MNCICQDFSHSSISHASEKSSPFSPYQNNVYNSKEKSTFLMCLLKHLFHKRLHILYSFFYKFIANGYHIMLQLYSTVLITVVIKCYCNHLRSLPLTLHVKFHVVF